MTEYASEEWWAKYKKFAERSRKRHIRAFKMGVTQSPNKECRILDLGSGKAAIGYHVAKAIGGSKWQWTGIDTDPPEMQYVHPITVEGDYRDIDKMKLVASVLRAEIVTAWFSTEVTQSRKESEKLYAALFDVPSVHTVFVAGFYYQERMWDQIVKEGEVESFQVPRKLYESEEHEGLYEIRFEMRAPSEMFGPDVVECYSVFRHHIPWTIRSRG